MQKKRILFITKHVVHDQLAMAGNQLFNYYLSRFCSDAAFEVAFLVVHKNDGDYRKMVERFGAMSKNFSVYLPKFLRLFTYAFYNSILRLIFSCIKPSWYYLDPIYARYYRKGLRSVARSGWEPDAVVMEWTEMLFLLPVVERRFPKAMKLATEHDVCFVKLGRQYGSNGFLKSVFVDRFRDVELSLLKRLQVVSVLSSDDSRCLQENGVSASRILLVAPFYRRLNQSQKRQDPRVLYFGAMNRVENQQAVEWFVTKVFAPFGLGDRLEFVIMGAGAPESFRSSLEKVAGVRFTGFVEQPESEFESALCMVVPLLFGGGIKIKVLEAMSCGVTVLTNQIGIEGIGAKPGSEYLHCESPADYRDGLQKLLDEPAIAVQIGEQARKLMENGFNYENSYLEYRSLILNNGEL